ncbi:MAG: DUF2080 family transposase-associated protein [archaeon]|nr:DUF2080 family transposase-associated protein [archaeon]
MRIINLEKNRISLVDDEIVEVFEKVVTPHGTGAKIPCSSKYIGKNVYVIVRR